MTENPTPETETPNTSEKTTTEEFTVSGKNAMNKIKEIVAAGNVRRIILHTSAGKTLLEIPLNAGVAVVGVGALLAPWVVAIGVVTALVTSVSITVVRGEPRVENTAEEPAPVADAHDASI